MDRATVKSRLANHYINQGYVVKSTDELSILFDRETRNAGAALLFTCGTCQPPRSRLSFNIVEDGKSLRIVADHVWLANEGRLGEQRIPALGAHQKAETQNELDKIFAR